MTLSYIRQFVGGGVASRPAGCPADYGSKQNSGNGRAVSVQPSLFVQADMGMGEPHSLLAMYASAEKQTCHHDLCGGINSEKANT